MLIIGFTGKAGVGKDEAGLALRRHLSFQRYGFADPIKDALNAMLEIDPAAWQDREWKESIMNDDMPYSPRFLAQTLGTEWGRETVGRDFWLRVAERRMSLSNHERFVITDIRFDNEAAWVQAQGGWVIEIVRPGVEAVEAHASEEGIYPNLIDFTIVNNLKLYDFQQLVVKEVEDKMKVDNV